MLSTEDKVYVGKMSLMLAEGLETIPKEMAEARQLVAESMLDGYKEQMNDYKQAFTYFREVFCPKYNLSDTDVYTFAEMYKEVGALDYQEKYYNQHTLSEYDLFGRELT